MHIWVVLLLALTSTWAQAEIVTLAVNGKLTARAEYRAGKPDKPAVLMLHGFLQTHEFPTTQRLANDLASEGYTVLAPTLSLNIPNRRQSLSCEAIHTHTLDNAVRELQAWVDWLKKKRKPLVLIGHSFGSVHLLAYLQAHPDPALRKLIGVSIIEGRLYSGEQKREQIVRQLRSMSRSQHPTMIRQQFTFCKQLQGTPQSLLSYLEWSPERILSTINQVQVPMTFIVGSEDDLFGPDWIDRLRLTRAKVVVIQGADHFMDGEHEFTLLDDVLAELKGL
jgi:pimeloyl-ACP methyl ester carboxylesterase